MIDSINNLWLNPISLCIRSHFFNNHNIHWRKKSSSIDNHKSVINNTLQSLLEKRKIVFFFFFLKINQFLVIVRTFFSTYHKLITQVSKFGIHVPNHRHNSNWNQIDEWYIGIKIPVWSSNKKKKKKKKDKNKWKDWYTIEQSRGEGDSSSTAVEHSSSKP